MKSFFKIVLANIVAIFLVIGMMIFSMVMLVILVSFGSDKPSVKEGSVLTFSSNIVIMDSPTEIQPSFFLPQKNAPTRVLLYDVLEAIKKAKTDDKIKGISIELDYISAGATQLDNIRTALDDFKKSGKFVYAYGNIVAQSTYYLGSVADQYYLNPAGGTELKGLSTEITFFKDFAEKYGIGIDVIRHGKFKAAVEPFFRSDISPENEEQLTTLLNDLWGNMSAKISSSRKLEANEFKTILDSLYGIIPENNLKYKLADKLAQKSEYIDIIKNKIGVKSDEDLEQISINEYIKSFKDNNVTEEHIAVLYASGSINNGNNYQDIYSENYVEYIKELADNDKVKAVVLRINSPGGSANASDEILFELQQLKKKKPLVVSFGDYAASGGYYIAMAADKIYSEANTLTGSIGVFGMIPNAKELANRNGIRSDVVKTNENSNYYSLLQGLSPVGKAMITKSVEGTYKRFVHWVAQNRKKTFDEIDAVGSGRVWSGTRAKQLGLVDEIGSLNDAIKFAANQAKVKNDNIGTYPAEKTPFEQFLKSLDEESISTKMIKSKLTNDQYKTYEMLTNPKTQSPIIMEMPYRISIQ